MPSRRHLRGYCDLDLLGLGFLTQRQPDRQHAGLVSAVTLPASTVGGSANVRANEPKLRSMRWNCSSEISVSSFLSPRSVSVLSSTVSSNLLFLHVGQLGLQHQLVGPLL